MATHNGVAAGLDSNGFIADIAYKVNVEAHPIAYTVNLNQSGTVFTTYGGTAATTFTLPAVASANGCIYYFINAVDFAMTIASAEGDNMVTKNDASADSIAFSTTSELIGAAVCVISDGTKWYTLPMSEELVTITVAT
jgi:hypothetical protein